MRGNWLSEIRRRNVHRAVIAYVAATWVVAQVIEFLAEAFAWPTWVLRAVVAVFVLGLPVVVALAWFFEITPAGLVREQDAGPGAALRVRPHRALDVLIVAILAVGIGYFAATHEWQGDSAAGPSTRPSATLAVLPFRPTVAASRDEALELGMADTLITRLSGVADVIVSPLSSVRRYSALDQDPIAAGRELGVESVLDGSVQKSGERLRVTARLLRVADGRQLWSQRFDEKSTDIFAVQDSIADRVFAALALELSPAEKQRLERRATSDTVAYDLFLNGRYYWNQRRSPGDLSKAIEFYSRAVERDPRFALAYSGLADAIAVQGIFGIRAPKEAYPRALAAAERALELDPDLAEAHATRGHIRVNFLHDWQGAMDDFDEAIRHDPRYAMAHMWRGFWLVFVGRGDEGLAEVRTARDLEPYSLPLVVNHARLLYWLRRYDEAEAQLARVLEVEPHNGIARAVLAAVNTERGRFDEALEMASQDVTYTPGGRGLKGIALARAGRAIEARAELARLEDLAQRVYVSAYDLASVNAALGDGDGAFAWLDRATVEHSALLPTLRTDPVMDSLRSDPRYADLEIKIRMPPR